MYLRARIRAYAHEERFLERFRWLGSPENSTFGKISRFWKDFYFSEIWKDCRKDFGKIARKIFPKLKIFPKTDRIFPKFRSWFLAFP